MTTYENTPVVTIEITHTFDGKPVVISKRGSLQLRNKNLFIGEDKIFDIFGKNGQTYNDYIEYNHVDITKAGRDYFNVPENWTSHLTKIRIYA